MGKKCFELRTAFYSGQMKWFPIQFGIALRSSKAESSRDNSPILFELPPLVDKPIVCFLDATR